MKILLDTHILVWYFDGDKKLSCRAWQMIDDNQNEIYFSSLAIFEVDLKRTIKPDKMSFNGDELAKICEEAGFKCLPLELKHALAVKNLTRKEDKPPHKDPFDNLMLAQAIVDEMIFITHNQHIAKYETDVVFKI